MSLDLEIKLCILELYPQVIVLYMVYRFLLLQFL